MNSESSIIALFKKSESESVTFDVSFVEQHVKTIGDLQCLVKQCDEFPHLGFNVYKSLSWELFDKVCILSTGTTLDDVQQHVLRKLVSELCEHVRPREMLLMVLEKLSMCSEVFTFQLLLHAMEAVLIKADNLDVWKQGLDATLRRATVLCSASSQQEQTDSNESEEMDEDSPEFGEQPQSAEAQGHFIEQVLVFARILANRAEEVASAQHQQSVSDLLVGFVLSVNAHIIASVAEPSTRHHYLATTSSLLVSLSGNVYHIFEHIYRRRHALHRQNLHSARAHFLKHYCNKHTATQKEVGASTALTTDDANALHNRISQSEYCAVLCAYFDHTVRTTGSGVSVHDWSQCVCWDDVLTCDPTISDSDSTAPTTDYSASWDLVGISLFALNVLQSTTTTTTAHSTHGAHATTPVLPTTCNLPYLRSVMVPYVLPLLRSKVANPEGLQLAALLLTPDMSTSTASSTVPIFMSFLAQQTSAASYAHLMLSFYNCLPAQRSVVPGKVFWEAQDAARLGVLTASTNNILSVAQTLATAMAGCADGALRQASFQCLRAYLKSTEERSLFGLLLVLTEQCPFPNMAGLLIDLTKECVQAASKGESWCVHPATHAHLHLTTAHDAVGATPQALPWLQDSTDAALRPANKKRGFSLKKVLKPIAKPADTTTALKTETATTTEGVVDVDEMTLVRSKKATPDPRDPRQPQHQQPSNGDEDSYMDLRSGVTDIGPDRLIEVREAMPFMWAGLSPFWSPLVVQRFLVQPLKDAVKFADPQKLLECLDILAARVNLAQAFALKFLVDTSITPTSATTAEGAASATVDGVLDSYFAGSVLYAPPHTSSTSFPYAYSKTKAVKEVFALYYVLKQLRGALQDLPKSLPAVGAELDRTRVMLLTSNVEYALQHLRALCNKLYTKLAKTAE